MNLNELIDKLLDLSDKHGGEAEVIMADNEPVIRAIFSDKYPKSSIVITDR